MPHSGAHLRLHFLDFKRRGDRRRRLPPSCTSQPRRTPALSPLSHSSASFVQEGRLWKFGFGAGWWWLLKTMDAAMSGADSRVVYLAVVATLRTRRDSDDTVDDGCNSDGHEGRSSAIARSMCLVFHSSTRLGEGSWGRRYTGAGSAGRGQTIENESDVLTSINGKQRNDVGRCGFLGSTFMYGRRPRTVLHVHHHHRLAEPHQPSSFIVAHDEASTMPVSRRIRLQPCSSPSSLISPRASVLAFGVRAAESRIQRCRGGLSWGYQVRSSPSGMYPGSLDEMS